MQRPRILVTRSRHQASELADRLRDLGAEPILIPVIETVAPTCFGSLDAALNRLAAFHWLIFTSANAVTAFHRRQYDLRARESEAVKGTGIRPSVRSRSKAGVSTSKGILPDGLKVASIGTATSRALQDIGINPDLVPRQAVAESLADALLPYARQPNGRSTRFLLIRAEDAREYLPEALRVAGAEVVIAPAYRTIIPPESIDAVRELFAQSETYPEAITFTSSSTARNLFSLLDAAGVILPLETVRASIGLITSATLRELGYPPQVEAPEATVASLAEHLMKRLESRKISQVSSAKT